MRRKTMPPPIINGSRPRRTYQQNRQRKIERQQSEAEATRQRNYESWTICLIRIVGGEAKRSWE